MKKRLFVLFTAVVLMLVILSACGSNTKTTDNSANTTTTSSSEKSDTTEQASKTAVTKNKPTGKVVDIKVMAKDFEYDKKEIRVKQGDKVKITLKSDDGGHGLAIPAFNVDIQGNKSAEFVANKKGTFEYHCSIPCGTGHANMTGKLIVE